MPVFDTRKTWPRDRQIPYTRPSPMPESVRQAIRDLNAAVGWPLLVVRRGTEADYLKIEITGHDSSPVGRQGGAQSVQVKDELFTATHELMHALGFHHEEKHDSFPWATGPGTKYGYFNASWSLNKPLVGPWDKALWEALQKQYRSDVGAGGKVKDFRAAAKPCSGMKSSGQCDMGSIMMYKGLRVAVAAASKEARLPEPGNVILRETGGGLSEADKAALRERYPKPSGFRLIFHYHDKGYRARSKATPDEVVEGRFRRGKALVLGIDPKSAQVWFPERKESWTDVHPGRYQYFTFRKKRWRFKAKEW